MKKLSTFQCESCEQYIADRDLFLVVNRKTKEQMALHKGCVARLIQAMKPPATTQIKAAIRRQRSK